MNGLCSTESRINLLSALVFGVLLGLWAGSVWGQPGPGTGSVAGVVQSESGPVVDANVVIVDSTTEAGENERLSPFGDATGPEGRYRIADVPVGRYVLRVSRVGYKTKQTPITVESGETTSVDVTLRPGNGQLNEVVVVGGGGLTQQTTEAAAAHLRQAPGGANLIRLADSSPRPLTTLADALEAEPGVVVQEFFGGNDQPRLNIRGAGLQSNPQSRGLMLLHNGFPVNFADGSFVAGLIEPKMARHATVERGANARGLGGATLGGAVNFVAPTGRTAVPQATVTGGSYNTVAGHAKYGWAGEGTDFFVMATGHRHNGFREQNDRGRRFVGHANAGYRWSPTLETRFYGTAATLDFDIPGPLNAAQVASSPQAVSVGVNPPVSLGPNVPVDQPRRETQVYRAATRTTWQPSVGSPTSVAVEGGVGYQYTDDDFYFPVGTGVRSLRSHDLTLDLQLERSGPVLGRRGGTRLGVSAILGTMDRTYFSNERGEKGRQFADNEMQSATVSASLQQTLHLGRRLTLTAGVEGIAAPREIGEEFPTPNQRPRYVVPKDTYAAFAAVPADFLDTYWGVNPSLALRYAVGPSASVFGRVGRSVEPPTFNTLLSPRGGSPNAGPSQYQVQPLDAQRATTVEVGTRRTVGRVQWDAVAYRTWLQDELLTTSAIFGGSGTTANAPVRTIHQGLETQVRLRLAEQILSAGGPADRLSFRTTYNLNDFYFDTDERNQLAGVPRHRVHAGLEYSHPWGLAVEPTLTWMPQRTPTDHANTVYQDPYALWGARVSYRAPASWLQDGGHVTVFAEAENLADTHYASSYLVRDRVPDPPPQALTSSDVTTFIPGRGRSLRVGLTVGW
jgi:iron complex outermembrane receptor protein